MADSAPPPPPPPPPSATPPPPPPMPGAGAPNPASYASWGKRVLAYIIDYIPAAILMGIGYAIAIPSMTANAVCVDTANGVSCTSSGGSFPAFSYLFFLLAFIYWLWNRVFKMGKTGSSIGMGVAGTKAVKEATGEPLGAGLNFLRQILLMVDFWICYIGVLWPLWDSKRQCLISDKATGAIVLPTK